VISHDVGANRDRSGRMLRDVVELSSSIIVFALAMIGLIEYDVTSSRIRLSLFTHSSSSLPPHVSSRVEDDSTRGLRE